MNGVAPTPMFSVIRDAICDFIDQPATSKPFEDALAEYITARIRPSSSEKDHVSAADPWQQRIAAWIVGRGSVSVDDVLGDCFDIPIAQRTQANKNRVARSLRALGRERFQSRTGERREWRYRSDPLEDKITPEWLDERRESGVSFGDVLGEQGAFTERDKKRVGKILRMRGWDIRRMGARSDRERRFFPPGEGVL